MTLADRIVVMNGGRIEQVGTPLDLYQRPDNLFVAGFIGSPAMNFLRGRVESVRDTAATVALALGPSVEVPLARRAVAGDAVTLGHTARTSAGRRRHRRRLQRPGYAGGDARQRYLLPPRRRRGENLVVRDSAGRRLRAGDAVTVGLPGPACHLFAADGGRNLGRSGAAAHHLSPEPRSRGRPP